jgi:hypothetical protein
MQIATYVEQLQRHLLAAASPGGPEVEELAGRLVTALEAAGRVAILEALSEAAGEITRELAPGSVDVRLRGRDVDFAVIKPGTDAAPGAPATAPSAPPAAEEGEDAATSRTTLRLPDALKGRAEQAAAAEGVSLNTWLVRAVAAAVEPPRRSARTASSYTGWVR